MAASNKTLFEKINDAAEFCQEHPGIISLAVELSPADMVALKGFVANAYGLYSQVEGDESVGICLSDRVASLRLGESLAEIGFREDSDDAL